MKINSLFKPQYKGSLILSLIFGFGYVIGDMFILRTNLRYNIITILTGFILSFLFLIFFNLLTCAVDLVRKKRQIGIIEKLKTHIFRNTFLILIIFWAGHLIIKYPAGQCPDSLVQIMMGLGNDILTTHYPLMSTLLMSSFVKMGIRFGNVNLGIFIYVLIEALIMAAIFSYSIFTAEKKLKASDPVLCIGILFFAFSPYICGYVGQAMKDIYYSAGFVLLLTLISAHWADNSLNKPFPLLALLFASVLMSFFRKEGSIVLAFCFILLAIVDISRNKKMTVLIPFLILSLLIPVLINKYYEHKYSPEKGRYAELFSIPFQQTARYVSKHQDIISEEEKEAISKVFPYDELPDLYYSAISDAVKTSYNIDATREEIIGYFKAWATGLRKAPLCYLRATAEQNIYLIYFGFNTHTYYVTANSGAAYLYGDSRLFTTPEPILALQHEYLSFLEDMHSFPVLNIINNLPFYIWLLMAFTVIAFNEHRKFFLFISLPLYLALLVIICAPQIYEAVRYAYPIIWSFPVWLAVITQGPIPENITKSQVTIS